MLRRSRLEFAPDENLNPHAYAEGVSVRTIARRAIWSAVAFAVLVSLAVGLYTRSQPFIGGDTLSHGRFHDVHIYRPKSEVLHFVLFFSGDGGWSDGLADIARTLSDQGTLVAGIDTSDLFDELEKDGGKCVFPVGDLENLSHFIQAYYQVPTYITPILVGHSAGASLAYAALAQAPPGTFTGGLSLSFCVDLDLIKPLCKANNLNYSPRDDEAGVRLQPPPKELSALWIALHGTEDEECSISEARAFVAKTPGARFIALPGVSHNYDDVEKWMPQFDAAYSTIVAREPPHLHAPPKSLADLPIIEVPPTGSGTDDTFAVLFSGDGGWAGIDREVADVLASRGIPVAGWDSLRYFWTARTPSGVSADLDRILRYYAMHWQKKKAIVIGYSQGADVLPFAVNRLSPQARQLVARTVLMSIGTTAAFEFHVSNWFGSGSHELPIGAEMAHMTGARTLCLYGEGDNDSICPKVGPANATVIKLAGGHHFGGSYEHLADVILSRSGEAAAGGANHSLQ
jgi:type IV secretory pathway VirJ component